MTPDQRAAAMKAFEEWLRTCPDETCLSEAWLACASLKQSELDTLQSRLDKAEADNARLRNFVRDVRDNFDCDRDAHKYGTLCRCCAAENVLAPTEPAATGKRPESTTNQKGTP